MQIPCLKLGWTYRSTASTQNVSPLRVIVQRISATPGQSVRHAASLAAVGSYASFVTFGEPAISRLTPARPAVHVAFEVGPLLTPRTGIGAAVAMMQASIDQRCDVLLGPYACSFRGQLPADVTRLPLPAAFAHRLWSRWPQPRMDRWFGDAQVVHGTNYVVPPSRLPRVVSVYDCWFLRHPELASPTVVRAGRVLTQAVRQGAWIHASSQATAMAVRELLHTERVEVIPLAALPTSPHSAANMSLSALTGSPFVLAIGTLERRKNFTTLIAAFASLAGSQAELHLVLAGSDGDNREQIDVAIGGLDASVRSRVVLVGRVSDEQKHWLLRNAIVLAYPSLDEGFGFPLLEAMQHRLPIVASTAGSIPEVGGAAAVLVEATDAAALADGLIRVLEDSALRQQLIGNGQTQLARFSWDVTAEKLANLYHRLQQEGS